MTHSARGHTVTEGDRGDRFISAVVGDDGSLHDDSGTECVAALPCYVGRGCSSSTRYSLVTDSVRGLEIVRTAVPEW